MTGRDLPSGLQAGFTILEMLVVVMIVALAASVAIPMVTRPTDGVRLRTAANELQSALTATRAAAIARNTDIALMIDVDKRTFQSPVVPVRAFASDITARLTYASVVRSGRTEAGFRFFADGSSTGGDVTLSLHGAERRLCVDWLTGQARQGQGC